MDVVADKIGVLEVYVVSMLISGVAVLIVPFLTTTGSLYAFAIPFGLFSGSRVALISLLVAELFGLDGLATKLGMMLLFIAPAGLIGPTFAGWLYDTTQSYTVAFCSTGGLMLFSSLPLFALIWLRRKRMQGAVEDQDESEV